jgi:hypothetical protein
LRLSVMSRGLWWVVGGLVGLSCLGCSPSTVTASAQGAATPSVLADPFSLDGVSLEVTPVASRATHISAAEATRVLALQYVYVTSVEAPVLATVRWAVNLARSGPRHTSLKQGTLAWVQVFRQRYAAPSCPAATRVSATATAGSESSAVIVDASTGDAFVYVGAYPSCPGSWGTPTVSVAARYLSLPWRLSGHGGRYTAALPPCAVVTGSTSQNYVMNIVAALPLNGPCSGSSKWVLVSGTASTAYAKPASVGLLCAGHSPDVRLPLPAGCSPERRAD